MKIIKPDYQQGLLNMMASIVKHYGGETDYSTHTVVDEILQQKYDNLFVILVDGMGVKLIEKMLPEDSFLRKNLVCEMTTVYPSTTAAATTVVNSAIPPIRSGWLGWNMYFKNLNDHRILFFNTSYYTGETHDANGIYLELPYETVGQKLQKQNVGYQELYPAFAENGCENFSEMMERIVCLSKEIHNHYVYCYWDAFDSLMHEVGVDTELTKQALQDINDEIELMCSKLANNQLVMVIADHGQIDAETIDLQDYPDLCECFEVLPAVESRTTVFYIKEEMKSSFEKLFAEYFGKNFILLKSEDFVNEGYLGTGKRHKRVMEFVGDYVACAIDKYCLFYGKAELVGQHAGLTEDEMMIPLISYRK
jgi:Uncharacterized proteins of the AP superfamily